MTHPPRMLFVAVFVAATLLNLAPPCGAQQISAAGNLPVFEAAQLQVSIYAPQHRSAFDLHQVLMGIHGRSFFVEENGEQQQPPRNLQQLGNALMIYDTAESTQRILETLKVLDTESTETDDPGVLGDDDLIAVEFAPHYLALNSALELLVPFRREYLLEGADGQLSSVRNISVAQAQGLLVVRDTPAAVAQIQALLQRLDVPAPHVTITCLVLRATNDATAAASLAPDLQQHLSGLVGASHFEQVTMGMLTTSVTASREDLSLQMPGAAAANNECQLMLRIEAFDPTGPSVTFSRMAFSQRGGSQLSTRATLQAGEWLVLGAAGAQPVFVVLRLTPA